jgi:hypothetical protein
MPPHLRNDVTPPASSLQTWNGSFTYNGTNYSYNMVGALKQHFGDDHHLHRSGEDRHYEPKKTVHL